MTSVSAENRWSARNPCPICGGYDHMPRHRGVRCTGYLSEDGSAAFCTRGEFAWGLKPTNTDGQDAFAHRLNGTCGCGKPHGPAPARPAATPPHIYPDLGSLIRSYEQHLPASHVATYEYHAEAGDLVHVVLRFHPKTFRQARPVEGGWVARLDGCRRLLYRTAELAADPQRLVFVVEGEKDADRLTNENLLATTAAQGAGKWTAQHSEQLRGRRVAILPDADQEGEKHLATVLQTLPAAAREIRIVRLDGARDVSAWLDAGNTGEELKRLVEKADPFTRRAEHTTSRARVKEKFPPLPLDCLPAPLAALSEHMASIWGVDPALYAVPGLAVLSCAIGNSVHLGLPGGASASAMLWTTVVARTGSGKTPAAEVVLAPLLGVQRPLDDRYRAALDDWQEDSRHHRHPVPQQVILTDATWQATTQALGANPGGLLWWRDEVMGLFKELVAFGNKGGDYGTEDILSAWSQGQIRRQRVKDNELTIVDRPFLAICGGIQPKKIEGLGDNAGGRLSRLLPYRTDRMPTLEVDADPDPAIIATYARLVSGLLTRRLSDLTDRRLRLSEEARAVWIMRQRERTQQMREADDDAAEFLAKLDQHAARFALILHVCDHTDDAEVPVDASTVERGWSIARTFLAHQEAIFSPTVSDHIVMPQQRAFMQAVVRFDDWVNAQGGRVNRRSAQQKMPAGLRTAKDFNDVVEAWERNEMGTTEVAPGRGSPAVFLVRQERPS